MDRSRKHSGGLFERFEELAKRLQWLLRVRLLARWTLLLVCLLLVVTLCDWLWRPQGTLGRGMLTLTLWCGWGAGFFGLLGAWRRTRVSPLSVARRVESIEPRFGDRLSSAVSLLAAGPAKQTSSIELTERVVASVTGELQRVPPERLIQRRSAILWIALASFVCAGLFAWGTRHPGFAGTAARRLLLPTTDAAWPQQNRLRLTGVPNRVHLGDRVEIGVSDTSGVLPGDTEIQFRMLNADGANALVVPPLRMQGAAGVATLALVEGPFAVRAQGGDDTAMDWIEVEVAERPEVVDYLVTVHPPAYTQREAFETNELRLNVMSGSELTIVARVAPRVINAELVGTATGDLTERESQERVWPVTIKELAIEELAGGGGNGANELRVGPIVLDQRENLRFRWRDAAGLAGQSQQQWQIEITSDSVPQVVVTSPESDIEVLATARVALGVDFTDDLGLSEVWCEVKGSDGLVRDGELAERVMLTRFDAPRLAHTLVAELDLQQIIATGGLAGTSGSVIELYGVAVDTAGQRGESNRRRLRIVDASYLQMQQDRRAEAMFEKLQQATRDQQIALEQSQAAASELEQGASESGEERLRMAEAAQRAAQSSLSTSSQSARESLEASLETAQRNQLADEEIEAALKRLEKIAEQGMQQSLDALDSVREQLQQQDVAAAGEAMQQAAKQQQETLQDMQQWVDELRQRDQQRGLRESLQEVLAAQTRLRDEVQALLSGKGLQEVASLVGRQRGLLRDTEKLAGLLESYARDIESEQPGIGDRAREAAGWLRDGLEDSPSGNVNTESTGDERGAIESMRMAANALEKTQMGQVEGFQGQALIRLERALSALQGSHRNDEQGRQTESEDDSRSESLQLVHAIKRAYEQQQAIVMSITEKEWPGLAQLQRENEQTLMATAERLAMPPGFGDALLDVRRDMQRTQALLERVGSESLAAGPALSAEERLRLLWESLLAANDRADEAGDTNTEAESDSGEEEGGPGQNSPVPLESLKLARALEEMLLRRTAEWDALWREMEAAGIADPGEQGRLQGIRQELATEQKELGDRTGRLFDQQGEQTKGDLPQGENAQLPANQETDGLLDGLDLDGSAEAADGAGESPAGSDDVRITMLGVSRAMREAGDNLSRGETGNPTQLLQAQAIETLERLIRQQEESQESEQPGQTGGAANLAEETEGSEQGDPSEENSGAGEDQAEQLADAAKGDSAKGEGGPGEGKVEEAGRERLPMGIDTAGQGIWGHLPAKTRGMLRSQVPTEYLPSYSQQISEYFRALSELKPNDR